MMLKITKDIKQVRVELFQMEKLNTLFSGHVRDQLLDLVVQPGLTVVFSLEGVNFIDTSGFEVLLEVNREATRHGSMFKLCNVTDEVRELILLMELEGSFTFCSCDNAEEKLLLELG